jgi:hypothetical protein
MSAAGTRGKNIGVTVPMVTRMQNLRHAGLSSRAVAAVMNLDYESERFTADIVRYYTAQPGREFSRKQVLTHSQDRTKNLPGSGA